MNELFDDLINVSLPQMRNTRVLVEQYLDPAGTEVVSASIEARSFRIAGL